MTSDLCIGSDLRSGWTASASDHSMRGLAAIDNERLSGCEGCHGRTQIKYCTGDLLGCRGLPIGGPLNTASRMTAIIQPVPCHRCFHEVRSQGIDPDAGLGAVDGDRLGQADPRVFRCNVGCHSWIRNHTGDGCGIDDGVSAHRLHMPDFMLETEGSPKLGCCRLGN